MGPADTKNDRPLEDHQTEQNSEQSDEGQAQDVAEDAMLKGVSPSEDSERGGKPNIGQVTPDDTPDLVEHMRDMVNSGIIDQGAFAGEPNHNDEAEE